MWHDTKQDVDEIINTLDEEYFALEKLLNSRLIIELKSYNHRFNLILKINMLKIKEGV